MQFRKISVENKYREICYNKLIVDKYKETIENYIYDDEVMDNVFLMILRLSKIILFLNLTNIIR